jgi:hypothetical protein
MGWLSAIGQMGSEYGQAKQNVAKEKRTNQREDLDDALARPARPAPCRG